MKIEYYIHRMAEIIPFRLISAVFFCPETVNVRKGSQQEREDFKMIDLSEKSREEIIREKKEAELREAKRREGEWKRRKDKERKCMIGGTFLKHFPDALLFEADEWDRIAQAVIKTNEFRQTTEAIRREAKAEQKEPKPTMPTEKPKGENGEREQGRENNGNG